MSEMQAITPFNWMKLLRHGDRVEAGLRGEWVAPISVEMDVNNRCSHGCRFCSFGTVETQGYRQQNWVEFPVARLLPLLDELRELGVKSLTFTGGGEPLEHSKIGLILEHATSLGFEWGVVTNGNGLRGRAQRAIAAHATFCRVSLDAGTSDTHQHTHRVATPQFHQILDNLRHTRAVAGDRDLTLGASFCVMRSNWKELYQAAQLVKEHGGNYLEVRPTYPTDWRGDGWNDDLSRDEVDAATTELAHAQTHLNDDTFQVIGMVDRFASLHGYQKGYTKCRTGAVSTVTATARTIGRYPSDASQECQFATHPSTSRSSTSQVDDAAQRRVAVRWPVRRFHTTPKGSPRPPTAVTSRRGASSPGRSQARGCWSIVVAR